MINLDKRRFSPVENSKGGRVKSDAVFIFAQNGREFRADYAGTGFTDGHLIGSFIGPETANLVYHCRAEDGALEVGEAAAQFSSDGGSLLTIAMTWRWLNGTKDSGTSFYQELPN